jgi:signal peptidase I
VQQQVYTELLREWIEAGEPAWLPVMGKCMEPFLPGGSRVQISKAAAGQIVSGDLLVYEAEGRLICHRVIGRRACGEGHAFLTKGDGWRTSESWVHQDQIIGKVISVERDESVFKLDTPPRRLHAMGAVVRSLVAVGLLPVLRWGKQIMRGQ